MCSFGSDNFSKHDLYIDCQLDADPFKADLAVQVLYQTCSYIYPFVLLIV